MGIIDDILQNVKDVITNISRITCLANSLKPRISNVKEGTIQYTEGGVEFISAVKKSAEISKNEIFLAIEYISIFIYTHLTCAILLLNKLPLCIIFYTLDMLGKIAYLPISIILWCTITLFNIDLYPLEIDAWNKLSDIDCYTYRAFGIRIIHFPKWVRDDCYICKTLKPSVVSTQNKNIKVAFKQTIPKLLSNAGREKMNKGIKHFEASLDKVAIYAKDVK